MRRDRGIVAVGDEHLQHPRVGRVNVLFSLVRDALGLLVRALDEADARAQRVEALEILFASVERRLEHDAHLAIALLPQRFEDLERHLGVRRVLHVDADEESCRLRTLEHFAQVVDGGRLVDVEAKLRELEREVPADAGVNDGLDDVQVLARGGFGLHQVGDALPQMIERQHEAAHLDRARGGNRLVNCLAGDEPACEARRPPHAVA